MKSIFHWIVSDKILERLVPTNISDCVHDCKRYPYLNGIVLHAGFVKMYNLQI